MLEFKGDKRSITMIIFWNWGVCRHWWLDDKTVKEFGLDEIYGNIYIDNTPTRSFYLYCLRGMFDIGSRISVVVFDNFKKVNRGAVLRELRDE